MLPNFANPFWSALTTEHAGFAIGDGPARRYPADILPFAGIADESPGSLAALRDLLAPGEVVYLAGSLPPEIRGLAHAGTIPGWQMHRESPPEDLTPPAAAGALPLRELDANDAAAMVTLTDLAFPGFFRPKTCQLGRYFGISDGNTLVAMAGERVALPGYREISAVCTHPAYTGRGLAASLICTLMREHAVAGLHSFLHVAGSNSRAIRLYEHLGFNRTTPIVFHRLRRA